jgi:predicted metal-dependent enzyme (double-stranded beta helix superfamily)
MRFTGRGAPAVLSIALFVAPAAASERSYSMDAFARDVSAAVHAGGGEGRTLERVAAAVTHFLRDGALDDRYQQPHPGLEVTTYLARLAPDASFSIAVLVLRPGARTPVHDHHTWTVWGTLRGHEHEVRYTRSTVKDGEFPALQVVAEHTLPEDGVSVIPSPPGDVHRVENVGTIPSVSIHVHGADISTQTRSRYDLERHAVIPFVQSYERPDSEAR